MKSFSKIYVYLRFSSDGQAQGHSFTRQKQLAIAYLNQMGADVGRVEWVEDPAISAFHGDHVRNGELGKLLSGVRDKSISNGLLIFESVDRASRQGSMVFMAMLHEFLQAGFSIAFLDQPGEPFDVKSPPPFFGTYLSIRADIARMESERKSDLSAKNWEKRRDAARERNVPLTKECPRWLRVEEDKYVVNNERVESINKVFQLAKEGWGVSKIVNYANKNKLPVPGTGNSWHPSLVNRLFNNRALIGEFQPHIGTKSRKSPTGAPIENYYPKVLDTLLFYEVRALRDKASEFPNKKDGNNFNYLMGMAKCECGGTWRRLNKNSGTQKGYAQYSCSKRQRAASDCKNLPARVFDSAFVGIACYKIPELLQVVDSGYSAELKSLEQQLAEARRRLNKVLELYEMSDDLNDAVKPRIISIGAEIKRIEGVIAEHTAAAPTQSAFSFGDAVSAYLPAFVDFQPYDDSPGGQDAFRLRALFRVRLMDSIENVTVNLSRDSMKIILKNGVEFTQSIEDPKEAKFSTWSEFTDSEEAEMQAERDRAINKLFGK